MNNIERLKAEKTSEEIPLTFLKMYEIPGHENISMYHFNRYLNDEKRWGENIRTLATIQVNKEKIQHALENEQSTLICEALNNPSPQVQKAATEMIRYTPDKEKAPLIRKALNSSSPEVQKAAAEMIKSIPDKERVTLSQMVTEKIRDALSNSSTEVQKIAAEMIWYAPLEEKAPLIRKALNSSSPEVQKAAAEMIWRVPLEEQAVLKQMVTEKVCKALNSSSPEVQKTALEMIQYTPYEERAPLIHDALNSSSPEVQKVAAEMIRYTPDKEKAPLIREALNSSSPEAHKIAIRMIRSNFWGGEQEALLKQALEKAGDILIESPLYDRGDIQKERFSRKEFFKSGSETTLIDGALKDKVIVRYILPEHFLSWKSLYEDHSFWKENGFDYVPIEPIVSYRLEKDGRVAVFSGVLDLNLKMWQKITSRFGSELEVQKNKILDVLNKKGIEHGHSHDGNFCLRFWRDENGRPDMTKTPRLYLIDFDQTSSS